MAKDQIHNLPAEELSKLVQELENHQAELKTQNYQLLLTQTELQQSRDKYQKLYDSAPVGYLTLNDMNCILESNLTAAKMLGENKDHLIGQYLTKFVSPDTRNILYQNISQTMIAGEPRHFEIRIKRRDEFVFNALLDSVPVDYSKGRARQYRITLTDITELKGMEDRIRERTKELEITNLHLQDQLTKLEEAESSLRESHEFNSALLEQAPYPIIVTNQDTSIKYVNPAFESLTGFRRAEVLDKKSPFPWFPPDLAQQFDSENMPGRLKSENPLERRYQKKNGEPLWIALNIKPIKEGDQTKGFIANWVDLTERKKSEEALKESEENFRLLMKVAPMSLSFNNGRGQIEFVNDQFIATFGYTLEDIPTIEAWVDKAFPNEKDRQGLLPGWLKALERSPGKSRELEPIELRVTCKDGSVRFVNLYGTKFGEKEIALFDDVTARKRSEEALKESEERLRHLFQSVSDGILVLDLQGVITGVNRSITKTMGVPAKIFIGKKVFELIGTNDLRQALEDWQRLQKTGTLEGVEYEFIKNDGTAAIGEVNASVFKDAAGNSIGYVITIRDVTERRKMEEELFKNRQQMSKLFQTMAEACVLWDPSLHIVEVNTEAERIFGMPREQLIGQPYSFDEWSVKPPCERVRPNGKPAPHGELPAFLSLQKKCEIRNIEFGHKWPDGKIIWLNASAVPVTNVSGEVEYLLCTLSDITERKLLRDEREYYLSQVTRAQEEERKRISRELHDDAAQHLSLLNLDLDHLINLENELSSEVIAKLKRIHSTAEQALQKIRAVSHELHPSVLENLGLSEALELIIGEFNQQRGVKVGFDVEGEEKRLNPDAELAFFRIAQESLNNIRKHSGASQVTVNLKYSRKKVRLIISDNGKGFDITKESFNAAKRGSLGLISMKERAALVGATLEISSRPKSGTTITVELKC